MYPSTELQYSFKLPFPMLLCTLTLLHFRDKYTLYPTTFIWPQSIFAESYFTLKKIYDQLIKCEALLSNKLLNRVTST